MGRGFQLYAIRTPNKKILQRTVSDGTDTAWDFALDDKNVMRQIDHADPDGIGDFEDTLRSLGYRCIQVRAIAK
jgi:hypothetical protein